MVRIDQIAAERTQPRKRPLLVGTGKLAVSGYISRKNGYEFPGLRHGSPFIATQISTRGKKRVRRRDGPGMVEAGSTGVPPEACRVFDLATTFRDQKAPAAVSIVFPP
jgi:hypothetical protein